MISLLGLVISSNSTTAFLGLLLYLQQEQLARLAPTEMPQNSLRPGGLGKGQWLGVSWGGGGGGYPYRNTTELLETWLSRQGAVARGKLGRGAWGEKGREANPAAIQKYHSTSREITRSKGSNWENG